MIFLVLSVYPKAFRNYFQQEASMLATYSEYTLTISFSAERNEFTVFDSHSCNQNGSRVGNGTAVMLSFTGFSSLLAYLTSQY